MEEETVVWDARDYELNLRSRLAGIVAEKISGVSGAQPHQSDYVIADQLSDSIDTLFVQFFNDASGK